MTAKTAFPAADIDLFSDQHLENPYPDYKSLRDAGPVVHMSRLDVAAIARYKPVREAVDNWHLALLQTSRLIMAFVRRGVQRFEITGETRRSLNNTTRAFFELPVTITVG
jgi:cytochrome P450